MIVSCLLPLQDSYAEEVIYQLVSVASSPADLSEADTATAVCQLIPTSAASLNSTASSLAVVQQAAALKATDIQVTTSGSAAPGLMGLMKTAATETNLVVKVQQDDAAASIAVHLGPASSELRRLHEQDVR